MKTLDERIAEVDAWLAWWEKSEGEWTPEGEREYNKVLWLSVQLDVLKNGPGDYCQEDFDNYRAAAGE